MYRLDPEKLFVEFNPPITAKEPIIPRRYTLTHSDITAELFLTIASEYAFDKITSMRDEVLAEWKTHNVSIYLHVYLYVGDFGPDVTATRNAIFRRELPLAMEAIVYGDRQFFSTHPNLNQAQIWVHFDSPDPNYNKFEYWGTPMDYK
ncbi:staygreen family protein [Anaerobacillus sp. CMMVII]|nr:staygreen family protein [Anaerobacillus sp. CMMVII]